MSLYSWVCLALDIVIEHWVFQFPVHLKWKLPGAVHNKQRISLQHKSTRRLSSISPARAMEGAMPADHCSLGEFCLLRTQSS